MRRLTSRKKCRGRTKARFYRAGSGSTRRLIETVAANPGKPVLGPWRVSPMSVFPAAFYAALPNRRKLPARLFWHPPQAAAPAMGLLRQFRLLFASTLS